MHQSHFVWHLIFHFPEDDYRLVRKYLETYAAFLNSKQPKVKRVVRRLERIKDKIGRDAVSVLFDNSNSVVDSKLSKQKEEHLKSQAKSCQPRRTNAEEKEH